MPTRSGRRYNPYGRATRSNTRLPTSMRRRNTTNNRSCDDCAPNEPAQAPEPARRAYGPNDVCKRHRKPDDEPKGTYVSGYRRR